MTPPKPKPLDDFVAARPLLQHIRITQRFFDEVVDEVPYRQFLPELHGAFMRILNEELAPHALTLALAITELEDAFPEILADATDDRDPQ